MHDDVVRLWRKVGVGRWCVGAERGGVVRQTDEEERKKRAGEAKVQGRGEESGVAGVL